MAKASGIPIESFVKTILNETQYEGSKAIKVLKDGVLATFSGEGQKPVDFAFTWKRLANLSWEVDDPSVQVANMVGQLVDMTSPELINNSLKSLKKLSIVELTSLAEQGDAAIAQVLKGLAAHIDPRVKDLGKLTDYMNNEMQDVLRAAQRKISGNNYIDWNNVPGLDKPIGELGGGGAGFSFNKAKSQVAQIVKQAPKRMKQQLVERRQQERAGTVTPGTELQRTHAQLGAEGRGGQMMRYARPPERPPKRAKAPNYYEGQYKPREDSWHTPAGKRLGLGDGEHLEVVEAHGLDIGAAMTQGWVRVAEGSVQVHRNFLKAPHLAGAMDDAVKSSIDGKVYVDIVGGALDAAPEWSVLGVDDVAEFLANPRKFIKRGGGEEFYARRGTSSQFRGVADSSLGYKERPLANRLVAQKAYSPLRGSAIGATDLSGSKPVITYLDEHLSPALIKHEGFHAKVGATGLDVDLAEFVRNDIVGKKLRKAFSKDSQDWYGDAALDEEVGTYLYQAIRTNDEELMQAFVDADGTREEVMNFAERMGRRLLNKLEDATDGPHKRALRREMTDLVWRTGGMRDVVDTVASYGDELYFKNGRWVLKSGLSRREFLDRSELTRYLDDNYSEPLSTPDLIADELLPDGIKFSKASPVNADQLPKDVDFPVPPGGSLQGGLSYFSHYLTPFYSWVDRVASKNNYPELYEVFGVKMKEAQHQFNLDWDGWQTKILDLKLHKISSDKRVAIGEYIRTKEDMKSIVAKQLNLTTDDVELAAKIKGVYDEGYAHLEVKSPYLEDYISRFDEDANFDVGKLSPTSKLTRNDIDFAADHIRTKEIDPKQRDPLLQLSTYFRLGLRRKHLQESWKEAAKLVNAKDTDGNFMLGTLQPHFKRHLDVLWGTPDAGAKALQGTMKVVGESINDMIRATNAKTGLNLSEVKIPQDAVQRMISMTYAGALGFRPIVPLRDSLQLLVTTLPILGGKYTSYGIGRAFRKGADQSVWDIPERYGALMFENPIFNLTGEASRVGKTGIERVAEMSLEPLKRANNYNRLASFWGHSKKAKDAILDAGDDVARFQERSGVQWLDDHLITKYSDEFVGVRNGSSAEIDDLSYRIARDMTDISQWNYNRGAAPGMYGYMVGRLFGQFGTWPMNYVDYARRLATKGTPKSRAKAMAMLAISHGVILKSTADMGIDASQWVFTQPLAFGGGPLATGMLNIMPAMDFASFRGEEARRELGRLPMMAVPGGLEAYNIWRAFTQEDKNTWMMLMGFHELQERQKSTGYHGLLESLEDQF